MHEKASEHLRVLGLGEWTSENLVQSLVIEQDDFNQDVIASIDLVLCWYRRCAYTHLGVLDEALNRVVGCITLLGVQKDDYMRFRGGDIYDTDIEACRVASLKTAGTYYLIFSCICVDRNYRQGTILRLLYTEFFRTLTALAQRGVYFKSMVAEANTSEGARMCKKFMKPVGKTSRGTGIYEVSLVPMEFGSLGSITRDFHAAYKYALV